MKTLGIKIPNIPLELISFNDFKTNKAKRLIFVVLTLKILAK